MEYFVPSSFGVLVLLWAVWRLYRKASSQAEESIPELGWLDEFSVRRYRPMERLLQEEDFEFFRTQPGYHPKIEKSLRAQRRFIFRLYLRSLRRDFDRMHRAARFMLVLSPQDQPELASQLLRIKLVFLYACAAVEFRLVLHSVGIGRIDVGQLLQPVENLHGCIRSLVEPLPVGV